MFGMIGIVVWLDLLQVFVFLIPHVSDIHEIIMYPLEEGKILLCAEIHFWQPHILVKKSYSSDVIP